MFWGPSIIQFGALFTLFLIWVFNKNPVALYHAKAAFDKRNADLAESQRGRARPDSLPQDTNSPPDVEGRASSHKYVSPCLAKV
ncbi:hypothetical protein DSO57_1002296 [Entomophthora muscae]|uniref:Uncharacterized protein n=1 Tax=Entomophthora muscae TaxID=34485 RepID=A0ACC2TK33_9FUNG|nr:hypothetical protein DSO57_1002296 [Entomophthora muscae]